MKYSVLFYVRDFDLAKTEEERTRIVEDVKQRISVFERERDSAWDAMQNYYRQEGEAIAAHENTYEFINAARHKEEVVEELLHDIEDYRKLLRFLQYEAAKRILYARMKGVVQS